MRARLAFSSLLFSSLLLPSWRGESASANLLRVQTIRTLLWVVSFLRKSARECLGRDVVTLDRATHQAKEGGRVSFSFQEDTERERDRERQRETKSRSGEEDRHTEATAIFEVFPCSLRSCDCVFHACFLHHQRPIGGAVFFFPFSLCGFASFGVALRLQLCGLVPAAVG